MDGFGCNNNGSPDTMTGEALSGGPVLLINDLTSRGASANPTAVSVLQALCPSQIIAPSGGAAVSNGLGVGLADICPVRWRYEPAPASQDGKTTRGLLNFSNFL